MSGWGTPLGPRKGRGISLLYAFGSYMSQVAEVTVANDGEVHVDRVVCAVDTGVPVNPDTIVAQMESGIIFGITAALWGEITLKNGRVEQTNFDDYRMLRINEAPIIEVEVVKSSEAPGGIGEPGTSTLTPAVLNAVYRGDRRAAAQATDQARTIALDIKRRNAATTATSSCRRSSTSAITSVARSSPRASRRRCRRSGCTRWAVTQRRGTSTDTPFARSAPRASLPRPARHRAKGSGGRAPKP